MAFIAMLFYSSKKILLCQDANILFKSFDILLIQNQCEYNWDKGKTDASCKMQTIASKYIGSAFVLNHNNCDHEVK